LRVMGGGTSALRCSSKDVWTTGAAAAAGAGAVICISRVSGMTAQQEQGVMTARFGGDTAAAAAVVIML